MEATGTLELARHYAELDNPRAALDALKRASSDELDDPEYWAIRSEALRLLDQPLEAKEAAERGLELSPDDIELLDLLALAYLVHERYDRASEVLAKALELWPDNHILLAHRGLAAGLDGQFEIAHQSVDEAMRLAPEDATVLRVRAQVAVVEKDPEAGRYVDELLELYPEDPTGHTLRGNLAVQKGQVVRASRAFEQAARLDPTDAEVVEAAGHARIASHPLLTLARPVWRFGRWRSYFLYLTLGIILAGAGLQSARHVLAVIWLAIVIPTWIVPPILRWRRRRKYGAF